MHQFPAFLQPIISQGFVTREFHSALTNRHGFRDVATRIKLPPSSTLPLHNPDYPLSMLYNRVGIASQFLLNAAINGEQAARTLDTLAREMLTAWTADNGYVVSTHCKLNLDLLLASVRVLRAGQVPVVDGVYNCYLPATSAKQLFNDPSFQRLFTGVTSSNAIYRRGIVSEHAGVRFIPIDDQHDHRVIIAGAGALTEYVPEEPVQPSDDPNMLQDEIESVVMTTTIKEQMIYQSWYYRGDFKPNLDERRAVLIEHKE